MGLMREFAISFLVPNPSSSWSRPAQPLIKPLPASPPTWTPATPLLTAATSGTRTPSGEVIHAWRGERTIFFY
jgi:hypothetical protein